LGRVGLGIKLEYWGKTLKGERKKEKKRGCLGYPDAETQIRKEKKMSPLTEHQEIPWGQSK